jgi:hypothetical protein
MSTTRSSVLASLGIFLAIVAACSGPAPSGSATAGASIPPGASTIPGPSATPGPSDGGPLSAAALKYRLIDALGRPWFCDPDEYPVARADEKDIAIQRFAEVQKDGPTFEAVVGRLALSAGAGGWTAEQKLAIYHEWKTLNAIVLDPIGDPGSRFDFIQVPVGGAAQGTRTAGTISATGVVTVERQAPSGQPVCPICLARGTRIDTPDGPRAVEELRVGDIVWTLDADGGRVAAPLLAIGSVRAPADHRVVHLVLADGRELWASPGHPLADGRRLGDLRPGVTVDGPEVVSSERVAYTGGSTFDVLPAGVSGAYWADGVALRSTLRP